MPVSITGARIKQRRKELGMSADFLATKIGVSRATMYRYENGDIEKVPVDVVTPLANVLGVSIEYLMGWDDANDVAPSVSNNIPPANIVRIAGRDGSYMEKHLSDEQIKALQTILDQMPEAEDI